MTLLQLPRITRKPPRCWCVMYQARDEAQGMKPSVARKLNEKIRALEAELDTLRTNKKVSDLEKKVKVRHSCTSVLQAWCTYAPSRLQTCTHP